MLEELEQLAFRPVCPIGPQSRCSSEAGESSKCEVIRSKMNRHLFFDFHAPQEALGLTEPQEAEEEVQCGTHPLSAHQTERKRK